MYLGDPGAIEHLEEWRERDLSPDLLPDILFDDASSELVGVLFRVDNQRLSKRVQHLADRWASEIVGFGSLPEELLQDFGHEDFLTLQWAPAGELQGAVGSLGEAVWYSLPETRPSLRPGRDLVAFAIHGYDDTLDSNELRHACSLVIPEVSAAEWNRIVPERLDL